MAAKNIKFLGNTGHTLEYWQNAAKQIEWPVDFKEQHISVPETEIETAQQNLMVQHFLNHKFFIQSCIAAPKTKIFEAPVTNGPIFKAIKKDEDKPKSLYNIGDKFRIRSDGCELQIINIQKDRLEFKYLNREKPNIMSNEEQLSKVLRWERWIKIE